MPVANKKAGWRRGMALIAFALMLVGLVPIIGLSIDVGLLYTVKSKLSEAVDAGALAGARSLSQGGNTAAQTLSAQTTARDYINANFPAGYYLTSDLTITDAVVDTSQANVRSVTTTATVKAPVYFLQWFSSNLITVNASATAVRRDANVMMVVDRSGSLAASGSCGTLRSAAVNFSDKFAEGRDNLGLVTFASSAFVDFPIGNTFKSASPNVATLLGGFVCDGATSSAMGLWMGYQELARLNQPNALNVILFFTDGQPTGITADYKILAASTCTDKTDKPAVYNAATSCCSVGGLLKHTIQAQPMSGDLVVAANSGGCAYNSSWSGSMWTAANDVSYIPQTQDKYGNLTETGYKSVPLHRNGGIDPTDWTSVTAAAVNAADNAGLRIRKGQAGVGVTTGIPNVVVFSLGLGTAGITGADDLLRRIANDPGTAAAPNLIYDSNYPSGFYVSAPTSADLADAFAKIASEILRLAR